jgi:hypothetical protein
VRKSWSELLKTVNESASWTEIAKLIGGESWFQASPDAPQLLGALQTFWSPWLPPGAGDDKDNPGETEEAVTTALKAGITDLRYYDELAKRYSFGP